MDKYIDSEIRDLSIANDKLGLILKIVKEQPKDYSYFYDYLGFSDYDIKNTISKNDAELELLRYWQSKLGDKEHLYLGNDNLIDLEFCVGRCDVYIGDDELENKLYENLFGSHSGINEFIQKTYIKMLCPLLGDTGYCHAFGSYDLECVLKSLENRFKEKDVYYFDKDEMKKYIDKCKQKIDYLFYIANNETIIEFNKKYRSYLENIVDKNKEQN